MFRRAMQITNHSSKETKRQIIMLKRNCTPYVWSLGMVHGVCSFFFQNLEKTNRNKKSQRTKKQKTKFRKSWLGPPPFQRVWEYCCCLFFGFLCFFVCSMFLASLVPRVCKYCLACYQVQVWSCIWECSLCSNVVKSRPIANEKSGKLHSQELQFCFLLVVFSSSCFSGVFFYCVRAIFHSKAYLSFQR